MSGDLDLGRFEPVPLQLGDEEQVLERAHDALAELEPGAIAVLPELVAWTPENSGHAFVVLVGLAQAHDVSIITTLNVPPHLAEDLPGRDESARYNGVVLFTRFGHVHVPQAKVTPQSFERSQSLSGPGIGVAPYGRLNRVRLDTGEGLLDVRFLVCSDLWALTRFAPSEIACDLLIVPGNFARGAEAHAQETLGLAREAGAAKSTLLCNAFHEPRDPQRAPLALPIDDLLEEDPHAPPLAAWPDRAALLDHFRVLDDEPITSFAAMVEAGEREGRIAVPRPLAEREIVLGEYPVTIVV